MSSGKHICAHPECTYKVDAPHVLCSQHWFKVPPRVKAAMQERIHGWKDREAAVVFYRSYLSNPARKATQ